MVTKDAMIWAYEVEPAGDRWRARQFLNGTLLKSTWADTEELAQEQCKTWAATAALNQGR